MEKLYDDILVVCIDDVMCFIVDEKCEKFFIDIFKCFLLVWIFDWILVKGDIVYKRGVRIGFIIGIVKYVRM